jgi:hypothetical protein
MLSFRGQPVEHVVHRKRMKGEGNDSDSIHSINIVPLNVGNEDAKNVIKEVLDKLGGHELSPEDIPHNVENAVERWKLKLKLSVSILKKVLAEGRESVGTELFQVLTAVSMSSKPKINGEVEQKEEDVKLLAFLIQELKEPRESQYVQDDMDPQSKAESRNADFTNS